METKVCTGCHRTLPLNQFYKDRTKPGGFRTRCKECFDTKTRVCLHCGKRRPNTEFTRQNRLCQECARTHKYCPGCQQIKPHSDFYSNPAQGDGLDSHCIACKRQWADEYRSTQEWRERDSKRRKRYEQTESYKESQRRYRQSAKGRKVMRRGWQKYYYSENGRRTVRSCRKRWVASPQGRKITRHLANQRRVKKLNAPGTHTLQEFDVLCAMFDHRCLRCGHKKTLTEDHIVPLSKGGSDDISNLQPLCKSCNSAKGDHTIDYRPFPVTQPSLVEWAAHKGHPLLPDRKQLSMFPLPGEGVLA